MRDLYEHADLPASSVITGQTLTVKAVGVHDSRMLRLSLHAAPAPSPPANRSTSVVVSSVAPAAVPTSGGVQVTVRGSGFLAGERGVAI